MRYNRRARLDSSQVSRGGGSGGKIALGGGGLVVVLLLVIIFGVDPGDLLGAGAPADSPSSGAPQCRTGADLETDRDCRFVAYTNSIQSYWASRSDDYRTITVHEFTGQVSTGCGTATAAVGPFYCSADTTVYLDLGFFDQLTGQLGAEGGDAAEAYVLAHEFGHHVQDLDGTLAKAQQSGSKGEDSASVRLELQADCYAGVWFAHATDDPDGPIAEVTKADLADALDAAAAVGDDRIQQKAEGQVDPETWTHGSAAMRQRWLQTGFRTGQAGSCDTFAVRDL